MLSSLSTRSPLFYQLYGLFLLAGLCFLAPFTGLSPVRIGYFFQCELGWAIIWAAGGGCALILFFVGRSHPFLLKKVFTLPIVWGWFLLGTLTLGRALFTPNPALSFVGSPVLSEGILTFFAFSMLSASMVIVSKTPLKPALLGWAISAAVLSGCLSLIGSHDSPFMAYRFWRWAPIYYGDYVSIIVLALAIFFYKLKPPKVVWLPVALLLGGMTYYASNRAFDGSLLLLPLFFLVLQIKIFNPLRWLKIGIVVIIVGITLLTLTYSYYESYLPLSIQNILGYSLSARNYLGNVTFYDLLVRPLDESWLRDFFMGRGAGFFGSILAKNVFLIQEITLFSQGKWQPNFEFVERDLLHSHNSVGDLFLSLGVIGIAVFIWIKLKIVDSLYGQDFKMGASFLLLYTIQTVFWFHLLHSWPYALLAFACLFNKSSKRAYSHFKYLRPTFIPLAGLLSGWGMLHSYNAFMETRYWTYLPHEDTLFTNAERFLKTPTNWYDGLTGGQRLLEQTRRLVNGFYKEIDTMSAQEQEKALNLILTMADYLVAVVPAGSSYPPLVVANNIYGEVSVHKTFKETFARNKQAIAKWIELADQMALYLPYRGELLIPYFNFLLVNAYEEKLKDFAYSFLENNPYDPVSRWFLGIHELQQNATRNKGLCRLKKSLALGIHKYMPLSSADMAPIQQAKAVCTGWE